MSAAFDRPCRLRFATEDRMSGQASSLITTLGRAAMAVAIAGPAILTAVAAAQAQRPPTVAAPAPAAAKPAAQPTPVAFPEAVRNATRALFKAVPLPPGGAKVELVVDPLVDSATGVHTKAAAEMGRRIAEIVRREFPRIAIVDFTEEALGRKPLLLIGTITALRDVGQDTGQSAAQAPYAIWLTLAATDTGKIVAKGKSRAIPEGVDASPSPSQGDSPVWRKDDTVQAYIDSCRKTEVGEQLKPAYVDHLAASAVIADAGRAYDAGRYGQALALYRQSLTLAGGRQLRSLNGVYASLARLGRQQEAADAFGQVVEYGLERHDLAVKLMFRPGTARFAETRETRAYPMWLHQIASKASSLQSCLEVVGHTSPTGPPAVNERLSQLRAEFIRDRLDSNANGLGKRMLARGAGSRENLVGSGKDDASDMLDRRVEFKVLTCS